MVDVVKSNNLQPNEFNKNYCNPKQPVLVKNEVNDWEATKQWDPEYLDCLLGYREAALYFSPDGITGAGADNEIETLPFSKACRQIAEDGRYYVYQHSIERPLISRLISGSEAMSPKLAEDIKKPRFLKDISKIHHVTNLWFGGDQCKAELHWDNLNNFFFQIFGKKKFLLFSPSQSKYLYPKYGTGHLHHSRVNVFDPDETKFPRYENANYEELTVEPGDMLFIPKGWWHATDSLTTSISVNFWWDEPKAYIRYATVGLADRFGVELLDLLDHPKELRV